MWFNATIANDGLHDEAFDVTLSASFTKLETQSITLSAGKTLMLKLHWNTTGFDYGNYIVSAYAWSVPNETNTGDNTSVDGVVTVVLAGDLNDDGIVDYRDVNRVGPNVQQDPGRPSMGPQQRHNRRWHSRLQRHKRPIQKLRENTPITPFFICERMTIELRRLL